MIAVEEALARITQAFAPLPSEWVALSNARGRVLAEDLVATRDQPHQDISAMDGYAIRSADLESGEAVLTLIGEAPAGGHLEGVVGPGETVILGDEAFCSVTTATECTVDADCPSGETCNPGPVTGYNDIGYLDLLEPSMTTVSVPYRQMGAETASMLLAMIGDDTSEAESIRLTPR